jgi:hypothetical protein
MNTSINLSEESLFNRLFKYINVISVCKNGLVNQITEFETFLLIEFMLMDETWRYKRFSKTGRQLIRDKLVVDSPVKKQYTQQALNNKIYALHKKGFLVKHELTQEYELAYFLQVLLDNLKKGKDTNQTVNLVIQL